MKVTISLVTLYYITAVLCLREEDGQYVPDNSGAYVPTGEEGQYFPDNSGRYIPDNSGLYRDDGSGRYSDDGNGRYRDVIGKYNDRNKNFGRNLVASATSLNTRVIKAIPLPPVNSINSNLVGSKKTGTFDDSRWKIIRKISDVKTDGYHWEYETENEITADESGKVYNKGTDQETLRAKGFFQYTGPDNTAYSIVYTADENGFVPKGDHLPVSLQRALDYLSTHKE